MEPTFTWGLCVSVTFIILNAAYSIGGQIFLKFPFAKQESPLFLNLDDCIKLLPQAFHQVKIQGTQRLPGQTVEYVAQQGFE